MRLGETAVLGVAFQMKGGRRQPPPSVDPWSKRIETAGSAIVHKQPYVTELSAVLQEAE